MPPTHIDSKSIFKRLKIWVYDSFSFDISKALKKTDTVYMILLQAYFYHAPNMMLLKKCYISQRYIIRRTAFNSTAASCNKSHIYLIMLFQEKTNEQSLPFQLMEWRNVIRCNQFSSSAHLAFSLSFKLCCFHLMFGYSVLYIFAFNPRRG